MTRRPVLFDLGGDGDTPDKDARDKAAAEARDQAAREAADRDRAARDKAAQEQAERAHRDRLREERDGAERARVEAQKAEHARRQAERARAEQLKTEREAMARHRAEQERQRRAEAAQAQAARDLAERERAEREKEARERQLREKTERERAERERAERAERERAERAAQDRAEQERRQAEQAKAAQQQAERAQRAQAERERTEALEQAQRASKAEADRDRQARARAERESGAAAAKGTRRTAPAPRLFETDESPDAPGPSPATAPPVPELEGGAIVPPEGRAMQTLATLAARRPSRLARFFWSAMGMLLGFVVSIAAWDFVTGLLERSAALGGIALLLVGAVLLAVLLVILRELAAFSRLRRLDALHKEADAAIAAQDLTQARAVFDHLMRFYAHRDDTAWGRDRLAERRDEVLDADALLHLTERELMAPLDAAATREVEAAARTVAAVTALVPITLADLFAALGANLRMIRRIAEIYGGRGGLLGSIRLARAVLTHLVATGMVAVGDDMISSIAGGGVLARVSRRFGEGVVNGALTARVGVAAMEVCRPLPFRALKRASVGALVKRALTGVFDRSDR